MRYVHPYDPTIPRYPVHLPHQAQYPAHPQTFHPIRRQESYQASDDYFRNSLETQDDRHGHRSITHHQQDRNVNADRRRVEHGSRSQSRDRSIISPRPYRPFLPESPQNTGRGRRICSFDEYNSDFENLAQASESTVGQPSLDSSITRCELCDQVGHLGYACRLARWDQAGSETPVHPASPDRSVENEVDQEDSYQQLAGKLSHVCWNMIPDSEQPPESHKTMMKHILHVLSQHPDNTEIVYNHMFGEEFQHKWLCLKAMCDPEWQGVVWLVDGSCRYCNSPDRADLVTLCYRIQPNRNYMALYREVGTVRA